MEELSTAQEIGEALQLRRVQRAWTQGEVAGRAGVSRQWLVKVEAGHPGAELGKLLSVIRALDLAVALPDRHPETPGNVDLDQILDQTDERI